MNLDHPTLQGLADAHGDAFFLVDQDRFERNFTELRDEFRTHYPPANLAYSYKTNYLPRFCSLVDRMDGYAEVVSRMEYDLARSIGVRPDKIIFNGPYKTRDDIETALSEGATVNIDGPRQLIIVEQLADRLARPAHVGVRVNFDLPGERPSRFGFAEGDLASVLDRLRSTGSVRLEGLHCHFSTRTRGIDVYRDITRTMLRLTDMHFGESLPRFVDLGGGFFSRMTTALQSQFSHPIPSFADYAEVIGGTFADHYAADRPELILEPGVSVTADTIRFVAQVMEVRNLNGRDLALVSGSIHNIKPTLNALNLPLTVVSNSELVAPPRSIDVVGYTCMEHDVLFSGYEGDIAQGDFAVFSNTGAYTNVLQPPFIRPAPPMIGVRQGPTFEVLRRGETLDDILTSYVT